MKYIKTFEKIIKNSDTKVINHPLLKYAKKLQEVLIKVKDLDKLSGSYVSMFFTDSSDVSIFYKGTNPNVIGNIELVTIRLINYDYSNNEYFLKIEFPEHFSGMFDSVAGKIFFEYMKKKYNKGDLYGRTIAYRFKTDIQDEMISDLAEFEEYLEISLSAGKYNI